ncbi:MAG: hypothetical protein ACOX0U_04875 [Oscillospiraceae bacterium]|jgi:hypothetical protein
MDMHNKGETQRTKGGGPTATNVRWKADRFCPGRSEFAKWACLKVKKTSSWFVTFAEKITKQLQKKNKTLK